MTNIFLPDSFCGSNPNSKLAGQYEVQKALGYLYRTWRISPGTSAAGLNCSCCFRNHRFHNYCFQACSAFWLHGIWDSVWVHWCSLWMQNFLALQRWRWRQFRNRNRWFVCLCNSFGRLPFFIRLKPWSSNGWWKIILSYQWKTVLNLVWAYTHWVNFTNAWCGLCPISASDWSLVQLKSR